MLFLQYPPCSTCKKAKVWLDERGISYEDRHIKDQNPTYEELKMWYAASGLELKKFFNTSGLLYKSMNLKGRISTTDFVRQNRRKWSVAILFSKVKKRFLKSSSDEAADVKKW